MTLYCSVGGKRVFAAGIDIPWRGIWTADLLLPEELPAALRAGKLTLVIAGLSLVGTIVRGADFEGDFKARMVGGAGGWRRTIAARAYQSAAGLRLGPILKDAAREAGEEIVVSEDRVVGQFFIRAKDIASRTLDALYPDWWVDTAGRAQIAARAEPVVATAFDLLSFDPARGRYEIATEHPESFAPGAKFTSPTTAQAQASLVCHRLTEGKLRTVVYAA